MMVKEHLHSKDDMIARGCDASFRSQKTNYDKLRQNTITAYGILIHDIE